MTTATLEPPAPSAKEDQPASISSSPARRWTPEHYTSSISDYAKQRHFSLFAGVHLTRIADYLRKPFDYTTGQSPVYNYKCVSDFATLFKCSKDGSIAYHAPTTPIELLHHSRSETSNILFLRGQPCAKWLVRAGTAYHVDPELFFRHLDFISDMPGKQYFSTPSLMSTTTNVIQLRYMTVGEFPPQRDHTNQDSLSSMRDSAVKQLSEYHNNLGKVIARNLSAAESMVRDYYILDKKHFAIEQQASISLGRTRKGWTVLIWLDTGRPLSPDQPGPWKSTLEKNRIAGRETFLPWIQSRPFAALHPFSMSIAQDRRPLHAPEQSASLIHLDYGKTLDGPTVCQDPFYALHELFMICAQSEVQFLNAVESKIDSDMAREFMPDHNIPPENMIYFQGLLDKHAESIRRTIASIKSRQLAGWPHPTSDLIGNKTEFAAQTLIQDYESLLRRTETLLNLCKGRLQILYSRAGIVESNKAIEQAKVVTRLTRLAFVFIPLSFVSSFFGMNLTPLVEKPALNLWVFFAVSAPLITLLFVSMTYSAEQLGQIVALCNRRLKPRSKTI